MQIKEIEESFMLYKLLKAQRNFLEIPHDYSLDVAVYQGGYGSRKTFA